MKNNRLLISIILASLLVLAGYCWVLIDWFQDMKVGRYQKEPQDWVIEIGVILAYCYLAYRFFQHKQTVNPTSVTINREDKRTRSMRHSYSLLRKMTAVTPTKK